MFFKYIVLKKEKYVNTFVNISILGTIWGESTVWVNQFSPKKVMNNWYHSTQ